MARLTEIHRQQRRSSGWFFGAAVLREQGREEEKCRVLRSSGLPFIVRRGKGRRGG
jgi:hypothetical protein